MVNENDNNKKMYNAAASGDVQKVKYLLENASDLTVNWTNENGNTALYIACARGSGGSKNANLRSYCEIVELLIAKGADLDKTNHDGKSPLYIAASWGHWDIVRVLIQNGANINATNEGVGSRTPLDIASYLKPRLYPNVNHESYYSNYGETRKHYTFLLAKSYMEEVMESKEYLHFLNTIKEDHEKISSMEQPLQVEIPDYPDYIMDIAAFYSHFATVVELAQASEPNAPKTIEELLKKYAKKLMEQRGQFVVELKNLTENEQGERLYNAAVWGNLKEVEKILNNIPNVDKIINWRNSKGNTPLYAACSWGLQEEKEEKQTDDASSYLEVAKLLIKYGADLNAVNRDNKSPLYISASWGLWNIVQLLIASGAELDEAQLDIAAYTEPRFRPYGSDMYYNNHKKISKHHLCRMAKTYMKAAKKCDETLKLLPELKKDYKTLASYRAKDSTDDIPDEIMRIIVYYNHFATIVELVRAMDDLKSVKGSWRFNQYFQKLRKCNEKAILEIKEKNNSSDMASENSMDYEDSSDSE